MAKKHKLWARVERQRLILTYGGLCQLCGTEKKLEFHCKTPQGDSHHRLDTQRRMSFYLKQHAQQNLQLLCTKCHSKTHANEETNENEPY